MAGRQSSIPCTLLDYRVWSFGCLTGRVTRASGGPSTAGLGQHPSLPKARAPQEINAQLSANLAEIVVKAMAVDKTKRYQTMDELRGALEQYM